MHHPNAVVLAVNTLCSHDPCCMQYDDGRRHLRTFCTGVHNAMQTCAKDVLDILVLCRSVRHRIMAVSVRFHLRPHPTAEWKVHHDWHISANRRGSICVGGVVTVPNAMVLRLRRIPQICLTS